MSVVEIGNGATGIPDAEVCVLVDDYQGFV